MKVAVGQAQTGLGLSFVPAAAGRCATKQTKLIAALAIIGFGSQWKKGKKIPPQWGCRQVIDERGQVLLMLLTMARRQPRARTLPRRSPFTK